MHAVVVGAEAPQHAGGSYVIVQKYLHDLEGWNMLAAETQERILGHTEQTSIEPHADGSRVTFNMNTNPYGGEHDILRDNMRFGSPGRGEVRHLLHRVRPHPGPLRADAAQQLPGHGGDEPRPNPGLLHARHCHPFLHAIGRLPG
nr:Dyp-type peroxidase domain-containing protein [Actinacidiphila guanduensis]